MPWRRVMSVPLAVVLAALFLVLYVGGWRALVLARIFRVENYPLIVAWPTGIGPQVPPGFHVSVFADGFVVPRWLAVAPNGDVWVSDSAAGQVIVFHGVSARGSAESRLTFAEVVPVSASSIEEPARLSPVRLRISSDPLARRSIGPIPFRFPPLADKG